MKTGFLDKLITRLDLVTSEEVQNLVMRLVKEKGFLENVFEALREGVLILDPEGAISFANQAGIGIFGFQENAYTGQNIEQLIRGLEWKNISHPERVVSRDIEIFYPEHRFLNFYLSPISSELSDEGAHLGYVMLVRDETESKKHAEEEWESEKLNALTLLAAGVAHEIGNPLNSIDIHMQLLARKVKKLNQDQSSDLVQHIETAQDEIRRLDSILKQFLQAVRPTQPDREKSKLHELLHLTLNQLETELEQRECKVTLDLTPNEPLLELDRTQIQQALYNLLRNASQSLPASGGIISIHSETTPYELRISISDNGSGISPEHMGSLFEPYKTTKKSGNGLGLIIVRRIIREHGGEIEIESEKGEGTKVTLFLPRQQKNLRILEGNSDTLIEVS